MVTVGIWSIGFQLVWAADNSQIASEGSELNLGHWPWPWSFEIPKQRRWNSHSFTPTYMHIGADLSIFFFPLPPSFTPLCVSVWYGKNVTHAETAATMATTHSPLYGQLTSGLLNLEVRQHKARTHAVSTMRCFGQIGLDDKLWPLFVVWTL